MRIAILGNAGSGKSTLSVRLAAQHNLPLHEIDALQWNADWTPVDEQTYTKAHAKLIAQDAWILDGPGRLSSLPDRLTRATHIILCDIPLWQNYWLLSERQTAWSNGALTLRPGGHDKPPATRDLFAFVWMVDRDYMPKWREAVTQAEGRAEIIRITDVSELAEIQLTDT